MKSPEVSLDKIDRPALYSNMTTLEYSINERLHDDFHYMWCTTYLGSGSISQIFTVPKSSYPLEIYNDLKFDHRKTRSFQVPSCRRGGRFDRSQVRRRGRALSLSSSPAGGWTPPFAQRELNQAGVNTATTFLGNDPQAGNLRLSYCGGSQRIR